MVTTQRVTDKDPAVKLAREHLSVLELAQELGRVSKACKQAGMDRTSFYEWKRRFQTHGLDGLKDVPPIHKNHPQTTPKPRPRLPRNALLNWPSHIPRAAATIWLRCWPRKAWPSRS